MSGVDATGPYLFGVDGEGFVVWRYAPDDLAETRMVDRAAEPLEDGNLLITVEGRVRIVSPGGVMIREILPPQDYFVHHDAALLPDGNAILLVNQTQKDVVAWPFEEPIEVIGDALFEVDPAGEVVWAWSAFDALDLARWPGELAQTPTRQGAADWTHANSVSYDAASDLVIVSLRHQNQVVAIDHATGDVAWLLGADSDFSLSGGEWFTSQHAATLIGDEVLLYDNGNEKEVLESRAVVYRLDTDTMAATETWSWDAGVFTKNLGDADRLANGNVLVCAGGQRDSPDDPRVAEIDDAGAVVWELSVDDVMWVYRAARTDWLTPVR
jgi:hypothetical protein